MPYRKEDVGFWLLVTVIAVIVAARILHPDWFSCPNHECQVTHVNEP